MDDLIRKLEQATCGSRELDCAIAVTIFPKSYGWNQMTAQQYMDRFVDDVGWDNVARELNIRRWTTSLDAALSLVPQPQDYADVVMHCAPSIRWSHTGKVCVDIHRSGHGMIIETTWGATAPLALCIAALRARTAP